MSFSSIHFFFFFNDTATTEIYTLSLHDALPISSPHPPNAEFGMRNAECQCVRHAANDLPLKFRIPHSAFRIADRKSTRLSSSHLVISYAVFCLKKKKKNTRKNIVTI